MMQKPYRILVFEDNDENYEKIAEPLRGAIDPEKFSIDRFSGEERPPEDEDPGEPLMRLVKSHITEPEYASLVVLDWDLTMYRNGVSRTHVQRACQELGVPLCAYHRDEGRYSNPDELRDYEEDLIKIDKKEGDGEAARAFSIIANGFIEIYESINPDNDKSLKEELYELLGAPSVIHSKLDQYAWGRSETIGIAKSSDNQEDQVRRMATFLGYWIHNQLLEYPGVLLNPVATASYLGIDHNQFIEQDDLKDPFDNAKYQGPFSDLGSWWWISGIDDVRATNTESGDDRLASGPVLFERLGHEDVTITQCTQGHDGAGYYCILREEPVCEEHSVKPNNWIPMGASRSRITEEDHEGVRSWMFD